MPHPNRSFIAVRVGDHKRLSPRPPERRGRVPHPNRSFIAVRVGDHRRLSVAHCAFRGLYLAFCNWIASKIGGTPGPFILNSPVVADVSDTVHSISP